MHAPKILIGQRGINLDKQVTKIKDHEAGEVIHEDSGVNPVQKGMQFGPFIFDYIIHQNHECEYAEND